MDFFNRFSRKAGEIIGSSWAFMLAFLFIVIWLISGPFFHYSENWQLVVNTTTTIITFLIAFLIQHAQNRDTKTIQLKLDELIHGLKKAKNERIGLEEMSDEQLSQLEKQYKKIAKTKQQRNTKKD